MKRFLLYIVTLIMGLQAMAQSPHTIHHAEYFFDIDPGFGNGVQVPFDTLTFDTTFSFTASTALLNNGLHHLFVRTYDSTNGMWSLTTSKLFFKEANLVYNKSKISRVEYFIDNDPGIGVASQVLFSPATHTLNIDFTRSTAGLSKGLHRIGVRARNQRAEWSLTTTQLFYYEPILNHQLPNITQAEYFYDNDPGFGLGTNIPITLDSSITFAFDPSTSSLTNGFHRLNVRTKDANGHWSLTTSQLFYFEPILSHNPSKISRVEYFIDNDPGFGQASQVLFSPATNSLTIDFTKSTTGLSHGLHRLYVRARNQKGEWTLTTNQLFYYEPVLSNPLVNVVKMEYFFDTDPGFGNATNVPLTSGQDISIDFNGDISSLSNGLHRLLIRTKDTNGKWSITTNQLFYNESILSHTAGNLVKFEWFWDTDPGFGQAHPVNIPGNQTEVTNFGINIPTTGSFSNQIHNLYIRVLDDWSQTTVIQVDFTGITLPVTLISFKAKKEGESVKTEWHVTSEKNMDKYIVERSTDGKDFLPIGEQKANGNSGNAVQYTLYDEHPLNGLNYYRLRQVELSGEYTYSPIATVLFSEGSEDVSIYPNPAYDYFKINSSKQVKQVRLTNMTGKLVKQYNNTTSYSLDGLAAGSYIIQIELENNQVVAKPIIIQ